MTNWLEKVRRWIDDEKDSSVIEQILQDSKNAGKNKSKSELFLQGLLKEIEKVLQDEITRIPNTQKAYTPQKFVVFISSEDEKTLPKEKREFFEQSLSSLLMERAREMAGQLQLTAKSIQVEIRINAILAEGEVEVKAFSEKFDKTLEKSLKQSIDWKDTISNKKTIEDTGTIEDTDFNFNPLYRLEIIRDGKIIETFPIIKPEITVGRDEDDGEATIRLKSDNRKISRLHAAIQHKENGEVWVTALAQNGNPTIVSGKAISQKSGDKTARLEKNNEIQIYEFTLRLNF